MANPANNNLITTLIVFLLLILAIAYSAQINTGKTNFLYTDYGKFYQSAQFVAQKKNIYSPTVYIEKTVTPVGETNVFKTLANNLSPPFFELLVLPLTYLSYPDSLVFWSLLSILGGVISILLIQQELKTAASIRNSTLGLTLALFAYFPTFCNVQFGQSTLLLLPLLTGAWVAARRNHSDSSGLLLALATCIKPFFGIFLLYFLLRREWRSLFWFMAIIFILSLIPLLFFGSKIYADYYTGFPQIQWYSTSWNASFLGFFMRLFGGHERNIPLVNLPVLTSILRWLCSGFVIVVLGKLLWPNPTMDIRHKIDLDFSLLIVAMLLVSPLGWLYYFPFLIIPFIVLFTLGKSTRLPTTLLLLSSLALFLSALPTAMAPPNKVFGIAMIWGWSASYFFALVLLFGLLCFVRSSMLYLARSFVGAPLVGALVKVATQNRAPTRDAPTVSCPNAIVLALCITVLLPSFLCILRNTSALVTNPAPISYLPYKV